MSADQREMFKVAGARRPSAMSDDGAVHLSGDSYGPLFKGDDYSPPRARNTDPETSHQAAASMAEGASGHRRAIMVALRTKGGMTGDALDDLLSWKSATACRRLKELVDSGLVVRTIEVRKTRSGRDAGVYRIRAVGT